MELGVTASRMRAKDLTMPSRQIRVPRGTEQTLLDRVRPYTALGIENYVSHTTAALLHGMPLPYRWEQLKAIHLTRPAGTSVPRRRGVIGHKRDLAASETMMIDGVRVTTPERTLLDLSTILTLDELVAAADFTICAHHRFFEPPKLPLVAAEKLASYVAGKQYLRGLKRAQAAMELMRVGADSPKETQLRLMLHRSGLPEFTTNCEIHGKDGENPVYPDLGCERYKVCSEYEGGIHLTPEKQLADRNRDQRTIERGWRQVKVYNKDMLQGHGWVLGMFRQALTAQGWSPQ